MTPHNTVTIHDIAEALKINSSTVSRALNNSSRVTQKTKNKILAKAHEMGYQRNLLASNLRKNKTNTIGVIVPRISRHFFSSAIAGIEESAYEMGYKVIICQSLEQLEREKNLVETLVANRVDGIILSVSMETIDSEHLKSAQTNGTPVVFFDRHCNDTNHSKVLNDDVQGGYEATQHLINKGCRNIVHFAGPQILKIYKNRQEGYRQALQENDIAFRPELVFNSRLMEKDGLESAKKLLDLPFPIDGIFSANDIAAIAAMQYLKKQKKQLPDDISIVGFSNEPTAAIIEPALTTMDQSGREMGQKATTLLLDEINDKSAIHKAQTIILKPLLIERNSTKRKLTSKI